MGAVSFVRAEVAHAEALAPNLRANDVAEVLAGGHASARAALVRSLEVSDVAYALLLGEEVAALFGVAPMPQTVLGGDDSVGIVWLLTGKAVARRPKDFLRSAPYALNLLWPRAERLSVMVDARYGGALSLLRSLQRRRLAAVRIHAAQALGPFGVPFCRVDIRRN